MSNKRTKQEMEAVKAEIRRYLVAGATNEDIIRHLSLPKTNYFYYLRQIEKEDKSHNIKQREEKLEHEISLTKERLLSTIKTCQSIIQNEKTTVKEKLEAERLKSETSIDIIRLIRDGVTGVRSTQEIGTEDVSESRGIINFFNSI